MQGTDVSVGHPVRPSTQVLKQKEECIQSPVNPQPTCMLEGDREVHGARA
jgi:hypothetical protein